MEDMQNIQRIDDYIKGLLPKEEAAELEAQIARDTKLAQRVLEQKRELQALQLRQEDKLRSKMKSWHQAAEQQTSFTQKYLVWIISAVILIALAFFVYKLFFEPKEVEEIIAQYYEKPEAIERSTAGLVTDTIFNLATTAYYTDDYELADSLFREVLRQNPTDFESKFYLANTLFLKGDYQQAIPLFQELEQEENLISRRRDQSSLYKILSYVQLNKMDTAQRLLDSVQQLPTFDFINISKNLSKDLRKLPN